MNKAIQFLANAAVAVAFAALGAVAWHLANVYMEIPAPITPLLWICGAFFWFFAVAYVGAALFVPFRKAEEA